MCRHVILILYKAGAEIADTEDRLFVIGQSPNTADDVQSAADNQSMVHYNSLCMYIIHLVTFLEDGLHNDTITEQGQNSLFLHPEETFASSDVIKQFSTVASNPGMYHMYNKKLYVYIIYNIHVVCVVCI